MTRCQICGRRKGLRKDRMILHHYVGGEPCPGLGYPPIEESDARLEQYTVAVAIVASDLLGDLAALFDARANYIDPALIKRYGAASALATKIERRLERHRAWPERYRRQMERQGWGSPPPDYLIKREREKCDAR